MLKKLLFLIYLPAIVFSQTSFNVDFDVAHFYSGNEYSTIEFYYSFSKNSMTQVDLNGQKVISGNLKLVLLDSTKTRALIGKEWKFDSPVDIKNQSENQKLTGLIRYFLSPGQYYCELVGSDVNNTLFRDSTSFTLTIPNFAEGNLLVSDIQLATSITQNAADDSSPFYKNTLEVMPNPSAIYGYGLPVLYFYYEIYNVDKNINSDILKVSYELINSSGEITYNKTKFMSRTSNSLVDIGAVKVNSMVTGQYNFIVTIEDTISKESVPSSKRVFIFNPDLLDTNNSLLGDARYLSSKYLTMSEDELDMEFSQSRYVASNQEKVDWNKLTTVESKREYLYNFWSIRDINSTTPVNETQIEYKNRVDYSRRNYSDLSQKEGWKSDRGRVYILYGAPSEVERHPYDSETVPYEIWYYNEIEGGVIFVFADYSGFSNYKLLHSTKRGELQDENWGAKISR